MKRKAKSDRHLKDLFKNRFKSRPLPNYFSEIGGLMLKGKLSKTTIDEILKKYKIEEIRKHKEEGVNLILTYIHLILADNHLTLQELENTELLKTSF
jgi:hypothetical protein